MDIDQKEQSDLLLGADNNGEIQGTVPMHMFKPIKNNLKIILLLLKTTSGALNYMGLDTQEALKVEQLLKWYLINIWD